MKALSEPLWLCAALLACAGCLPGDERPEPASLFVGAAPSEATAEGFATSDGWHVRFDRFVTAVGDVRLREASCTSYSETHYEWLYDFAQGGGGKVGLVFGLGTCSVAFRFRDPSDETVLGAGASDADVAFMSIEASDLYVENDETAVLVQGQAERDGVEKRFDWAFRQGYTLHDCASASGDQSLSVLAFEGGAKLELHVELRGEELFRQAPIDEALLHFDPIAAADADDDGLVTLSELDGVDAPLVEIDGEVPDVPDLGGLDGAPPTMADLVYIALLPRIARVAGGGACQHELRQRGGGPGP